MISKIYYDLVHTWHLETWRMNYFQYRFLQIIKNFKILIWNIQSVTRILQIDLRWVFLICRFRGYADFYVDDPFLQGKTFALCWADVTGNVRILKRLRFSMLPDKSILIPNQNMSFLGFITSCTDLWKGSKIQGLPIGH